MARAWRPWLPAILAPAVIAAGSVALAAQAGAAVDLPEVSAEELLTMVTDRTVDAYSGTFEQTSDLGLPALPADLGAGAGVTAPTTDPTGTGGTPGDSGALDTFAALELLTGSRTGRVFVSGPDRARVQLIERFAERDVIVDGDEVWFYDSQENTATHVAGPTGEGTVGRPPGEPPTPESVADHVLASLEPHTEITVGTDALVAGREAYELRLAPLTTETLVESIAISVDGENGLPLGVSVRALGQSDPAFVLAYTALDLTAPDPGIFAFTPPSGATVMEEVVPDRTPGEDGEGSDGPEPSVVGEGWSAVVVLPPDPEASPLLDSPLLAELVRDVEGGRLLTTALVNVLVADDGRLVVGAVPPERLLAAAGT